MKATAAAICTFVLIFAGTAAAERQLPWGDTHLHTNYSFDAFLNNNLSVDPDTAFRFARGQPVIHPFHRARMQLETPLDYLVVSDQAEFLGAMRDIYRNGFKSIRVIKPTGVPLNDPVSRATTSLKHVPVTCRVHVDEITANGHLALQPAKVLPRREIREWLDRHHGLASERHHQRITGAVHLLERRYALRLELGYQHRLHARKLTWSSY